MPHGIEHRFDPKVIGDLTASTRRPAEHKQIFLLWFHLNGCDGSSFCKLVSLLGRGLPAKRIRLRFCIQHLRNKAPK